MRVRWAWLLAAAGVLSLIGWLVVEFDAVAMSAQRLTRRPSWLVEAESPSALLERLNGLAHAIESVDRHLNESVSELREQLALGPAAKAHLAPRPQGASGSSARLAALYKDLLMATKRVSLVPPEVAEEKQRVCGVLRSKGRAKLADMFDKCYANTLETTVKLWDDNTTFVITGDIHDMWLRDSAAQVHQYMPLAARSVHTQALIEGLIRRHVAFIKHRSYSNSFRDRFLNSEQLTPDERSLNRLGWVAEDKYELDSTCYTLWLVQSYYEATGIVDTVFTERLREAVHTILNMWRVEQNHERDSPYRFRDLSRGGLGSPVGYTGMSWSGFRPSDDVCTYHYLVPSNMFATVVLDYVINWTTSGIWEDAELRGKATKLRDEIHEGINKFGVVEHPEFGRIYAYEVDGLGGVNLMDDANVPNLVSIPYLGYRNPKDPQAVIAKNTRRFALSKANPFYFAGSILRGVGSPHLYHSGMGPWVWHISLCMIALTAESREELLDNVLMLEKSDAGTNLMHENVNANNPSSFTRPWFAWANSLFSEMIVKRLEDL